MRRLGPGWLAFRLRYATERKTGLLRRRSPLQPWPAPLPATARPLPIVQSGALRQWLTTNLDGAGRDALSARVSALREHHFDVFGTQVTLASWHDDPRADVSYPAVAHWSDVEEFPGVDLKRVWEPSRFGWAFDLARAELALPDSGAGELFWELLDWWMQENPPNAGVNWACGQEASIRLMAVTAVAQAMAHTVTDDRATRLVTLAAVTGRRVAANIAYARSQRNNHHASEAVGLLTAGYWMGDAEGERLFRLGERHLVEVAEELIFPDGGSSQYSTNYHRVFVQDLVWASLLYQRMGRQLPHSVDDALRRAAGFLSALVEPISGWAPFFGPDDGARVLPLDQVPHRQLAHDSHLACAVAQVPCLCGIDANASTEGLAWFGLTAPASATPRPHGPWAATFPDMGVHLLGRGTTRVYVRCGEYRFRPTQEDQLHCDIWVDGQNIATDAGTQSYTPAPGEPGALDRPWHHNTVTINGQPHMPKVSRFLWARWAVGSVHDWDPSIPSAAFELRTASGTLRRRVRVGHRRVAFSDSAWPETGLQVYWNVLLGHLSNLNYDISARLHTTVSAQSAAYGDATLQPTVTLQATASVSYSVGALGHEHPGGSVSDASPLRQHALKLPADQN